MVRGEGAGLVGEEDVNATEGLDRGEALDQDALEAHAVGNDREDKGDGDGQALGDVGNEDAHVGREHQADVEEARVGVLEVAAPVGQASSGGEDRKEGDVEDKALDLPLQRRHPLDRVL